MLVQITSGDRNGKPHLPTTNKFVDLGLRANPEDYFMTASRFWAAEAAFDSHFMYEKMRGGNDFVGIEDDYQFFDWTAFMGVINSIPGPRRMVLVHLGMEEKYLRYGFSVVPYTETAGDPIWRFTEPAHPQFLLEGELFTPMTNAARWDALRLQYMRHVSVRRTDEQSDRLVPVEATDSRYIAMPWEREILRMHDITAPGATRGYRGVVNSVTLFSNGVNPQGQQEEQPGYYHGIAIYLERFRLVGGPVPMLDEDHVISIYKNKAADLGNRCPPRCREYHSEL